MSGTPLRYAANLQRGSGFPHEHQGNSQGDIPFFKVGDFAQKGNERHLAYCENWISAETARALRAIRVPAGSVLLPKIGAALLNNARRLATRTCVFDNNILAVVPGNLDSRYLYYWLSIVDLAILANPGPVPSLNDSALLDQVLPIADPGCQAAIADFLDAETARIDALIAGRARQLGLLLNRERSLIESTLVATAQGNVTFRRLLSEPPQYGATDSGEPGEASWPRYIRITDLAQDGTLRDDDVKRLRPEVASTYSLREGDLLFARSGATVGKAFRYRGLDGAACFAGYLIRFRVDRTRVLPELIELWSRTRHYWDQIGGSSVQATIQNVNADRYLQLLVPNVGLADQAAIVRDLQRLRQQQARLRRSLEQQTSLLRERRQALIAAAVTGELAIPGAAA